MWFPIFVLKNDTKPSKLELKYIYLAAKASGYCLIYSQPIMLAFCRKIVSKIDTPNTELIAPKGFDKDAKHMMIYLRLLRLPINIKIMSINYTIHVTYTPSHPRKKRANVVDLKSLSVRITIDIQEMIDLNDKVIPKHHWEKYGVVMNQNKLKLIQKLLSN
eukprot:483_1